MPNAAKGHCNYKKTFQFSSLNIYFTAAEDDIKLHVLWLEYGLLLFV